MTSPGESVNNPTNPFDKWSLPEHAGRQVTVVAQMEQDNPKLAAVINQWADLLVGGELAPYDKQPAAAYAESGAKYPTPFTYENPFPERHGFIEYDPNELERPNPPIHMALDAAVKKRNPNMFVAGAKPGVFDPYFENNDPKHPIEYYVLGNLQDDKQNPGDTADRALAVRGGGLIFGELAPRYSAEGRKAREAAKTAIADRHAEFTRRQDSARELGASVMSLMVQRAAERLAEGLSTIHGLTGNDEAADDAHQVLALIWVADADHPGHGTTVRTIAQLLKHRSEISMADMANAFARLYPNDTPEELAARMIG